MTGGCDRFCDSMLKAIFEFRVANGRSCIAVFLAVLVAVLAHDALAQPVKLASPGIRRPNIIVLVADDVGYGDLGAYGQKNIKTPNLDQLAKEGARLTAFYAMPDAAMSRAALLTGINPSLTNMDVRASLTLPQLLKEEGYRTGFIGQWGLG